jgi:hypothetical protein
LGAKGFVHEAIIIAASIIDRKEYAHFRWNMSIGYDVYSRHCDKLARKNRIKLMVITS